MKSMFRPELSVALVVVLLTCTAAVMYRDRTRPIASADTIFLLLPDSTDEKDVPVQVWVDAASEEGLHLEIVRDSALLDPMFQMRAAGLILPDQVHREANDALIGALHRYVQQGGKLMIVYDACTWDLRGRYATSSSRLSDLAGVDYALYDRFGTSSIASGPVWGTTAVMRQLTIPPGSYMPVRPKREVSSLQRIGFRSSPARIEDRQALVGYLYGELEYPSFQTAGTFQGKALLQSETGLVAGENKHGTGDVLFVNLPLGYLVTRTDGMLLHSFLRYFARDMLHLPTLVSVPDGIGGLVMNWHIDAASALKPMAMLRKAGIFDHGPFSADLTAGPDVDAFHDGKGLDLQNRAEARAWVEFLEQRGDEVGSHGGWIHNYFGKNLSDSNQESFQQYLVLNKKTIEGTSGRTVGEYSAPLGNQPAWVTRWLEKNNVLAYYFTGDAGMGPTRVYRDQGRDGDKIWAFPILHFGTYASLEEMHMDAVPAQRVGGWLKNATDFTASLHMVRLIYSHPIGATRYIDMLEDWLGHAEELARDRRFRWYTMTQIAKFLNERQDVTWSLDHRGTQVVLTAKHPRTLMHQAWMFPLGQYSTPHVLQGAAEIHDQDGDWIVTAKDCRLLRVGFAEQQAGNANSPVGDTK